MTTDDDAELLAQHHAGSATAFAAIVRRHADWIAGVARRRVGGDAALVDDVVQATFLVLAQRSRSIRRGVPLAAWLFRVACNVAGRAARDRQRRAKHERQAAMTPPPDGPGDEWAALAPLIDALVEQLRQPDREAILLRFYRQQPYADVGRALGIGEEAARKRVDRAVERLRDAARRRGIEIGATTFAALLATGLTPTPATAGTVAIATTAAANHTIAGGNAAMLAKGALMTKATAISAAAGVAIVATAATIVVVAKPHATPPVPLATSAPATTRAAASEAAIDAQLARLNALSKTVLYAYLRSGNGRAIYPGSLGSLLNPARRPPDSTAAQIAALMLPPSDQTIVPEDASPAWVEQHTSLNLVLRNVDVTNWTAAQLGDAVALHTPIDQPFERNGPVVIVSYADGRSAILPRDQAIAAIEKTMRDMMPADARAAQADLIRTMSNLRQIGNACMMKATTDGKLPATLGATLETMRGVAAVYLTPRDAARFGKANIAATPAWVDANASFAYLGGGVGVEKLGDAVSKTVLAHTRLDAPLTNGRGEPVVVALFVDGHVETLRAADAPAIIATSKATLDVAR